MRMSKLSPAPAHPRYQDSEIAILAVTALALLLLVGLGVSVIRTVSGAGDRWLPVALFLDLALIVFGWRKHRDLLIETAARTAAEERARVLASHDGVTGLRNRRSLIEDGAALLLQARRRGKAVALLAIDLERFRRVNDLDGHASGDTVLRIIAAEISAALPGGALAARIGGEAFACAFGIDAADTASVDQVAERIASRLAQPISAGAQRIPLCAAIGLARSDETTSIEALLRSAEIAASAAQKAGRDRVLWFAPAMEQSLQARAALERDLRAAIGAGEVVPFFERQIDLASGRLCGFEVLARWDHPTRGTIAPNTFVPVAEEAGLIGELSLAVMRRAFAAAADWDGALTLSVNLSPFQLRDAWLPQKIIKTLVETGFPASRLEIEITEHALIDNLALAQSIVRSLRNQGIRVALDDFGTGYSSLAHLRALPFDRIKIDRSITAAMRDDAESAAIVEAIAALGASLHLPITAEGIGDADTAARLLALGCVRGQGYLYGRPQTAADVRRLLAGDGLLVPAGDDFQPLRVAG